MHRQSLPWCLQPSLPRCPSCIHAGMPPTGRDYCASAPATRTSLLKPPPPPHHHQIQAAMVRIHLDDQMDSKSLMGAYVCTARPGEFVWQPGPLTQVCVGVGGVGEGGGGC